MKKVFLILFFTNSLLSSFIGFSSHHNPIFNTKWIKTFSQNSLDQSLGVFLVRDEKGNHFVLKVAKNDELGKAELHSVQQLKHKNIIKLSKFKQNSKNIYLLFPYYKDGDLADFFNKCVDIMYDDDPLDESYCKLIAKKLVDVLIYINSLGYAHRDLKPENILVIVEGYKLLDIVLTDFEYCGQVPCDYKKEIPKTLRGCGTVTYWAPEIRTKRYTQNVDIYSLGCLLQRLFTSSDVEDTYYTLENSSASSEAISFISSCLIKNPRKRPTALELKNHHWLNPNAQEEASVRRISEVDHGSSKTRTKKSSETLNKKPTIENQKKIQELKTTRATRGEIRGKTKRTTQKGISKNPFPCVIF